MDPLDSFHFNGNTNSWRRQRPIMEQVIYNLNIEKGSRPSPFLEEFLPCHKGSNNSHKCVEATVELWASCCPSSTLAFLFNLSFLSRHCVDVLNPYLQGLSNPTCSTGVAAQRHGFFTITKVAKDCPEEKYSCFGLFTGFCRAGIKNKTNWNTHKNLPTKAGESSDAAGSQKPTERSTSKAD